MRSPHVKSGDFFLFPFYNLAMGDLVGINKDRHLLVIILIKYLDKTYFRDRDRVIAWMDVPNPHFGNVSPRELILNGRANKVWQFIENAEYDRGII